MVVKKKAKKETLSFEQLEQMSRDEINLTKCERQKIHAKIIAESSKAGFYFSVVFATQCERDKWCKEHGVILRDSEYILAKDYSITMGKR